MLLFKHFLGSSQTVVRTKKNISNGGVGTLAWTEFLLVLAAAQQRTLKAEPYTVFWQRFMVGLMRLLPIESQL